jgi:hypothetical protein
MTLVYIAGPYSSDPEPNVKAAIVAAEEVLQAGMIPHVPHLSHYWHTIHQEHDWDTWLKIDIEILLRSDAVLRIPGESKGADLEMKTAILKWIPVFLDMDSLTRWYKEIKGAPALANE